MLPEGDGVIGDRNDRERADHEWQAKPKQAIGQIVPRSLPSNARPYKQSRQKEEHRHEEAVGGEHDHVEADPGLGVGMTEIGIGDDRMVKKHHERQEGAGAIEREVPRLGLWYGVSVRGGYGLGNRRHTSPRQAVGPRCCNWARNSARPNVAAGKQRLSRSPAAAAVWIASSLPPSLVEPRRTNHPRQDVGTPWFSVTPLPRSLPCPDRTPGGQRFRPWPGRASHTSRSNSPETCRWP